jgi:hypothetical protein
MIKNINKFIEKFKTDEDTRQNVKKYSVFCLLLLSLIIFYNYVDFNKYSLLSQVYNPYNPHASFSQVSNPYNPHASFSKVFTDDVKPEVVILMN